MEYYIAPIAAFDPELFGVSHYLVLPSGNILIAAVLSSAGHRKQWLAKSGVRTLPHILSSQTVSAEICSCLEGIGVVSADTTFDVAAKASQFHPCMAP